MRRFILITAFFFLLQNFSLADDSASNRSGSQSNAFPRKFLPKRDSSVNINKTGEPITVGSKGSTLEEILQRLAVDRNLVLRFHCNDPSLNQERGGILLISADSPLKILQQLLPEDYRFSPRDSDGKETEGVKDMASISIYPKGCAGTDPPVRVFASEREQRWLMKPLGEISLEELSDVRKTQGPSSRRRAADALGLKGEEKGIPYAKEALKDENPVVMLAAANALRRLSQKFGPERVSAAIYERFLEKPYAELLPIMAEVDKDAFFAVIPGFMELADEREKAIMTKAFSLTHDRRAIKNLSSIASTGSLENSRHAIYAIGKIAGPEAESSLMRLLSAADSDRQAMVFQAASFLPQGEGAEVRAEIEKVVQEGRISDQSLQALATGDYLHILEKSMKDPATKPDFKIRVLVAMGRQGSEKTIQIISLGLSDKTPRVRLAAVEAMGILGVDAAIPYLVKATEDEEAEVREAAVRKLADFQGDYGVNKALSKAIYDKDERVRRSAVSAIFALGKASANEELVEVLKDCAKNHQDPYVANRAGNIIRSWHLR